MRSQHLKHHIVRIRSHKEDKIASKGKDYETMTYIAEHDPVEEGEGDTSEESRICLFVISNTVSLDDLLG